EEARERGDRSPGQVHVRGGLQEPHLTCARDAAVKLRFGRERSPLLLRQRVDEPEPRVVTRGFVLATRIAESNDKSNRCGHVNARISTPRTQQKARRMSA